MLVFLTGFMGSGKSYTGRHLAKRLNYPFMDMDRYIEVQEGRSISEIFETDGEAAFREMERNVLHQLHPPLDMVVSTGGGLPCHGDNMAFMNEIGLTIFLDIDKEVLVDRLLNGRNRRPLLKGMNEYDLGFFYDEKMKERRPFYEQAAFQFRHQQLDILEELVRSMEEE